MLINKKKISLKTAGPIMEKLDDSEDIVSLGKFVAIHFEILSRSGKNLRQIYEYLKANWLDVGEYHSFRSACYRAGLRQRTPKTAALGGTRKNVRPKATEKEQPQALVEVRKAHEADKPGNLSKEGELKAKVSKYNPNLPPILLPGGLEAFINPETGAKGFEIESSKD
jgi:hypothetical protein